MTKIVYYTIPHYFNSMNKVIPESLFDANITTLLSSYTLVPVSK